MFYFLQSSYSYSTFFHRNLRMLFLSMCLCCLSYDLLNIIMKAHHLSLSLLFTVPCDLLLPKPLYIALHLPTIFVLFASQFMQFSLIVERWAAMIFVRNYESSYRNLGPALIGASLMITACILLVIYHGENFDGPHINGRWFSIKDVARTNLVLMSLLVMNFIGLVLTVVLHFLRPKRKIGMSLSSKFQANENSVVTNFLFLISTMQFTALFFSQAILLYVRIFQSKNPLSTAYKENADLFNYYTLALPILSMFYLTKVKRQRSTGIRNIINIRAIGHDGWMNYAAIVQKQWQ
ncbi:hypothetical protein GCK32_015231 [Trichostrongylus colubriformis]|uniref:Uncharacterized protein n=1 Tax=Trichostrongylus colubriformis TaxID=6319 RepID=A0AAN8FJ06_TRICO